MVAGSVRLAIVTDAVIEEAPAPEGGSDPHPAVHGGSMVALALGALGVVFGDIGTSPLYALQTVFAIDDDAVRPTPGDVYGVISLVFWSITLIVSVKYVAVRHAGRQRAARAASWPWPP